jgi:ABC-2 type transport system ATP-binding protein
MADTGNSVVRTVGLTKTFRDFWLREKVTAVRDLDLNVRKGEVYGLLGPNGSGKSTTLKMVLGLMFPTRGRVTIFDRNPESVAIKSRLGFLPEESYLYPFLNAWETLDYYGRLFRQPRQERRRRIEMLLDMVGLTGVAYRRVGEYSKGMQRRIGMAQALINDPELLILDEPTSGMDPLAARQFKDLINELSRRGKTMVLSSHLLADMEDVCDRVGILYAGQLRTEGTLDELLSKQSLTQIVTERLEPQLVQQVRQLLSAANKQVLAVEAPKDKLEALFLRIIRDAQRQSRQTKTATVVETGQVAAFLRADDGDKGIDRLVAQSAPAPEVPAPPSTPAAGPVADKVVRELLTGVDEAAKPQAPAPAAPAPPAQVNRGVLDDLTRKKSDHA